VSGSGRILAAMLFAVLLVGAMVGIALAATQGSCLSGDTTKFLLWENVIGDTQDNNDNLWLCSGDSDLSNNAHTLAGDCKAGFFGSSTWNDCVSSVSVWVPAGWCANFYKDANQGGNMNQPVVGPESGLRVNLGWNDQLSSLTITPC